MTQTNQASINGEDSNIVTVKKPENESNLKNESQCTKSSSNIPAVDLGNHGQGMTVDLTKPTIVVGSGPVGVRFVKEFLQRSPLAKVILFGNEVDAPYNRVQLSALLARKVAAESIEYKLPSSSEHPNFKFINANISFIDPVNNEIRDANQRLYSYSQLVLATGASAYRPNLPGMDKTGVFFFRSLKDAEALYARITRSRSLLVVGGGLLGIETAKALRKFSTKITLVHQSSHLMNRQLDHTAASFVQKQLVSLGINVVVSVGIKAIHGQSRVSSVSLHNGESITCDTVVLCTGISPNISLARKSGIQVRKGILISDRMLTSQPNIYAIGECCEHKGATYGLVNPGFEQAAVAAEIIHGSNCHYKGSLNISKLKILDYSVCSVGEVIELGKHPQQHVMTYQRDGSDQYRKLVIKKNRIIGALGVGQWEEFPLIQESLQHERKIWPWQKLLFRFNGELWWPRKQVSAIEWPDDAIICQCNNLSKSTLCNAIKQGCNNPITLQQETGAGTVCGSCQPLLGQLFNAPSFLQKVFAWKTLIIGSLICLFLLSVLITLPAASVSTSVQTKDWYEAIWNSKFWKQTTGFTLLGLTLIGLIMSLRKRLRIQWLGEFGYWRLAHVLLGASCCGVLFLHTGLHLGDHFNRMLMINFLLVLGSGALFGSLMAVAHKIKGDWAQRIKGFGFWLHLIISGPLLVLLITHIVTVYYF